MATEEAEGSCVVGHYSCSDLVEMKLHGFGVADSFVSWVNYAESFMLELLGHIHGCVENRNRRFGRWP
jgi:hypothetical protein